MATLHRKYHPARAKAQNQLSRPVQSIILLPHAYTYSILCIVMSRRAVYLVAHTIGHSLDVSGPGHKRTQSGPSGTHCLYTCTKPFTRTIIPSPEFPVQNAFTAAEGLVVCVLLCSAVLSRAVSSSRGNDAPRAHAKRTHIYIIYIHTCEQ